MHSEKAYHDGQTIANLLNRRMIGRSGTVYTPGSTMIVINDDKKRVRLEETAARVKVPRDPLADAIDFAGLHKDVLLGLANDEAIDAWADVWSDAVVVSRQPWGRFGALRRHAWDLSKPFLPPLLERSLRFDPHRWVLVGKGFTDHGLRALLHWSPKSLDLNGGFKETLEDITEDYEVDRPPEEQYPSLFELLRTVERIDFFSEDRELFWGTNFTQEVLELILPVAKNLRELFLASQICSQDWFPQMLSSASHPHALRMAAEKAAEGLEWAKWATTFAHTSQLNNKKKFSQGKLIVNDELFTLSECLEKAQSNPLLDIKTQMCLTQWHHSHLMWSRTLANDRPSTSEDLRSPPWRSLEEATLAAQVLNALLQTQHLGIEDHDEEEAESKWRCNDGGAFMWSVLADYLHHHPQESITIGGVVFGREDCLVSAAFVGASPYKWHTLAVTLYNKGPNATIAVKYDRIGDFSAIPRELNRLDCMCYAVYPLGDSSRYCIDDETPMHFIDPDEWLDMATMLKKGEHIKSLLPRARWEAEPKTYSAIDCCEMFFKVRTETTNPSIFSVGYRWLCFLEAIVTQGDVTAAITTLQEQADWSVCAERALEGPYEDESERKLIRQRVVRYIPAGGTVRFEGRNYTKAELKQRIRESNE